MGLSTRSVVVGGYGLSGISRLVASLPGDSGFAVLAVVPDQPDLVGALRGKSKLSVTAAEHGQPIEPNRIYAIPPHRDVMIHRGRFTIAPTSLPGVQLDRLLRSLSEEQGRLATAVLLEGPGTDGVLGIKRLKEVGGLVLAGPVPDGSAGEMPRAAISTGMVDQVGEIEQLAQQLTRVLREPQPDEEDKRDTEDPGADALRDILALVRIRSGHDFGSYKRATLYRRVARRMQVCQTESIVDYHLYLRDHPAELAHLLRDFLISVTSFFRDPDAYEALATQLLPKLFDDRNEQIRVWVAGCATGEEAYSLGMLLLEQADKHRSPPRLQMFATDIDEDALSEARAGRYPETIGVDVSQARLERFFVREAGYYRVSQELRELVLFSPHNLLRDPPFSRLDLVSCRNLLIYLNRDAQNRVLSMFHFGLRPEGHLFLGSSESAENSAMFSALDPRYRLFSRRMVPNVMGVDSIVTSGRWHPPQLSAPASSVLPERSGAVGELHHRLAERYAPPSILVNGELDVVHVSEHAGRFLEMAGGEPTRHILRLALPALRLDLRAAIYAARLASDKSDMRRVVFDDRGKRRAIEIRVRAVDNVELGPNAALIFFEERDGEGLQASQADSDTLMEPVVREMEDELHRTREQLRTTIEQYETSVEELKASNEELQAINEELRSASEELETSKEELQSVNEELTTLNHELKVKIDEVSHANSDLQNLMSSTEIGVVFLDRLLNIKRFTPRALDLFNLIPSDIGRPLAHLTHRLDTDELPELAKRVLQHLRTIERDVSSRDGHRYLVRLLPYRSLEDRIDGVVLTFVDVSDLREAIEARRRSEALLQTSEARLGASLRGAPIVVFSLDAQLRLTWGNALGDVLAPGPLTIVTPRYAPKLAAAVATVLASGTGERTELEFSIRGEVRTYDMRIELAGPGEVTAVGFDITSIKRAASELLEADRRKDEFLATLSHELRNPLTPLKVALDVAKLSLTDKDKLASAHAIMDRQLTALTELVDELLDLSRITQGKIELAKEAVEPLAIIEAALETTRPMIAEHEHELVVEAPRSTARVLGDPKRLTQILVNLIANAAKYTPAKGHIKVTANIDLARKLAVFEVTDDGVGIAPDLLPRVFEIFVQSREQLGRARGGLGIGLSLVKKLVELHDGVVRAASDGANRGSTFTVELPLIQ